MTGKLRSLTVVHGPSRFEVNLSRSFCNFAAARDFFTQPIALTSETIEASLESLRSAHFLIILVDGENEGSLLALQMIAEEIRATCEIAFFGIEARLSDAVFSHSARIVPSYSGDIREANAFEVWTRTLWGAFEVKGMPSRFPICYSVEVHDNACDHICPAPTPKGYHKVAVRENQLQTSPDYPRPIHLLTFDLKDSGLTYELSDHVSLWPENDDNTVERACHLFGIPVDEVKTRTLTIAKSRDNQDTFCTQPLPLAMTVDSLFRQYLDLNGKAQRRFLMTLSLLASDPLVAAELQTIATTFKSDSPYSKTSGRRYAILDVLEKYRDGVKLTLTQAVSCIPCIRPRSYSAASSPLYKAGSVQINFVVLAYPTSDGEIFKGLSTTYLAARKPGDQMLINIFPNRWRVNLDRCNMKLVGVALGSGVSALRGVCQHINCIKEQTGEQIGEMVLYYGVRHEKKDFIFNEEFEEYKRSGVLTEYYSAFSHDQADFITPATRIRENPEPLVNTLVDHFDDTNFFYCGPAGAAYMSIESAIIEVIEKLRPGVDARAHIQKLKDAGRWDAQAFTPRPDPENPFAA